VSDPPAPSPAPGAAPLGSGPTSPTQDPFKQPDPPVQTPTKQPEPDKMPDVKSNTILLDKQPGTSDVTPPAPPATAPPPQNNGPASTEPASPPPVMQPPAFTPVPTTPVAHAPGSPAVTPAPAAAPAPLNPNFTSGAMPTAALIPEPAAGPGNAPATLGPPGGRPATASPTAPISRDLFTAPRSAPPPEPKAQSYLEEQYRWQPNDTFAGVSQRFYFSDKYAPALAKYNQEYPLASPALRQNPPAPGPGQTVWIPPVRILERDYGQLISGLQPLGPNGVPATPASRPSGPTVVAVAPPPTAGPVGQYTKVRGGGENLYEIARRTLNDNGQWYLIYRLNPALSADPKLPIPAGTVLRLPPEARVADGDRP
jgi:hypothetical protein